MGAADSDPLKVASELGMTLPVVSSWNGIRDTRGRPMQPTILTLGYPRSYSIYTRFGLAKTQ
ncbi:hypothetical protein [Sunxiuqinia elliptica]|uniref:Uncharacterized protein n=1 Tax=Sunxiuqinia elliptica TaxID=655355 RepID=A0A4R6H6F2_9BACT|nr:hypothetical protein [Sunxiuqinia elliptica]TDO03802.1 hypothetical protein DET52_102137 [Sunxiuqinia elliptica]TDO62084.1 hypothetical protein DET65_1814 [Sunxiuqinia elliptica]